MKIGLIGLGRMGQSIAARLLHAGFDVIGYDKFPPQTIDLKIEPKVKNTGLFKLSTTVNDVAEQARLIMLMVPAGTVVDDVIHELLPHLKKEDIIIDGGNSFFKDSICRFELLKSHGVHFLDCGTSGGLQGRSRGFSLMIGGEKRVYEACESIFRALAAPDGYLYTGPAGSGHYVKMVHNGIEYGILQSYAEGFHLLHDGHYKDLNLERISNVWIHGSIIRSWILELAHGIFRHDRNFKDISGSVNESGTGLWTVEEAERHNIAVTVIKQSLNVRHESRKTGGNYATKIVALLRHAFGGHSVKKL